MIAQKYADVNLDNTVKLLVRCKQLLISRQLAFCTLSSIFEFEGLAKQIRENIDTYLEASPKADILQKLRDNLVLEFQKTAENILGNIAALRDQHKLFSKMGATTSKGH